ncbi:transcription termination/antitermination protein NusG [Candidatus Phytoplasma sacchari]|uniref:Transcription termination/antitermination protein NusG n=1 Tax=Candidatus Phytoplasma sacchari TaxID=2609813 RepID=A0ABY7M2L9_9MOLU|nr:transcription termination/antitermination protein NusG [Candidatus Phytoplasma sacchari]KAB8122166.1 transcription termination/antitermination factor NusG [Candidatus Phytoplasma sacchari]WBL31282.1 transcription termination/antitermination protein NusG [Candidatus Phytoplasma sacchari]
MSIKFNNKKKEYEKIKNKKKDEIELEDQEKEPKWYIIQTYSGYENSVQKDLLKLTNSKTKISKFIFDVICPHEKYFKIKSDGTKKEKEKKMFSGYVFVKMIVNNYSWFVVRNIPKVTNFLGSVRGSIDSRPVPVSKSEIEKILFKIGLENKKDYSYLINKKVEIINGSFSGQKGKVKHLDYNQNKLVLDIDLFGRTTSIEISFSDFKEIF